MKRVNPARRIQSDLEADIRSGRLRPGDRIPIEQDLAGQYGCARATVSKALGELTAAGLIERRRKAGSFVAHPPVHSAVMTVPDLAELIEARGETYRWEGRSVRTLGDAKDRESPPVLRIEGVHFGGDDPFALEDRIIELSEVPSAADVDFRRQAPGTWLLAQLPWTEARHAIRAVGAKSAEARALQVAAGTACLELERDTWRSGRSITHVRQLFPGDRFDLVAEFGNSPA